MGASCRAGHGAQVFVPLGCARLIIEVWTLPANVCECCPSLRGWPRTANPNIEAMAAALGPETQELYPRFLAEEVRSVRIAGRPAPCLRAFTRAIRRSSVATASATRSSCRLDFLPLGLTPHD